MRGEFFSGHCNQKLKFYWKYFYLQNFNISLMSNVTRFFKIIQKKSQGDRINEFWYFIYSELSVNCYAILYF